MTARKANRIVPNGVTHAIGPAIKSAVLAVCGHTREFRPMPAIDDEVWCKPCGVYRKVILLQANYSVRCRDCRYSRGFARALFAADKACRAHGERTGHTVDRYDGSKVEWTHTASAGTIELSLDAVDDDPPPF